MARFVNPSNLEFCRALNSSIYVDKSDMVALLNGFYDTENRFLCLSRPRRFGKTMMTNLMVAYYSKGCDSRELFQNLKLGSCPHWDKHLNSANVIFIDLNEVYSAATDRTKVLSLLSNDIISELRAEFPQVDLQHCVSIPDAIAKIYTQTSETFVVIIDEYDVLIRETNVSNQLRNEYIFLLNALFKGSSARRAISLAYLTGILPIIRDRVESKLNNFSEYTMLAPKKFAPYFGFTEQETKDLCLANQMDYARCQHMYDGYAFDNVGHVFNPNSVVRSIFNHDYNSYWTTTSAFDSITFYIDANIFGIQDDIANMLKGREVEVNVRSYTNTIERFTSKDHAFTYLTHLGYLAYNEDTRTCRIPNGEIRAAWFDIMEESNDFTLVKQIIQTSRNLIKATERADADAVAQALNLSHAQISSPLTYNREATMQSAILMAYFYARKDYYIFAELPTGKGFADVVLVPTQYVRPAIIIELKKDASPEQALDQIKQRDYSQALARGRNKGLVLVGVSYNSQTKQHQCAIEVQE
ncbi:MAG: AAA family ATPase [Bacteroidales bacterium]|nr:ATP-binding protein [Bacteroidales bacterium]MDD5815368.1 AAA family ATPase [Bacteroidales bacterium]MDY4520222.1 AAA family ATPase [Bacteroidales bacterium]